MPKQIQKTVPVAPKQARPAPKNPATDAPERPKQAQSNKAAKKDDVKNSASDNGNVEKNDDAQQANFGELVSDVAKNTTNEADAAVSELPAETAATVEPSAETAAVEPNMRADELAVAKLVELNLNTDGNAEVEAPTVTTEVTEPEVVAIDTKNTDQTATIVKADSESELAAKKPLAMAQVSQPAEPQAKTAPLDAHASNDNLATTEASELLSAVLNVAPDAETTDEAGNERVANYLNKLVDRLEQLSPEVLEKAGIEPKQMSQIISHVERLANLAETSDFPVDVEKLVARLSHIFSQNQGVQPDGVKIDNANLIEALAAIKPEPKHLNPAHAAQAAHAENADFDGEADNDNIAQNAKAKHANANEKASQTAENASPKANGATRQSVDTATTIEANKYADRYSKTANAENTDGQMADEGDEPASQTRTNAAYNSVKSAAAGTQKAAQAMSALDKISQKNPLDFLTQMQNGTANQALDPNSQENISNVKLAMQNGRLAQNPPLNSMAFQISKQFNKGNGEFQIKLDPAELGRINIKLTLKQGGNVKVHMVVERNDVFELLQRDARALEKALSDAGLDGNKAEVEFSLDQNGGNGSAFADNFFNQSDDQNNSRKNGDTQNNADDEILEMVASHVPQQVSSTGIDRKVWITKV